MNVGQKKTHCSYYRHVRKEHAWISGRTLYTNISSTESIDYQAKGSDTNSPFVLAKITNTPQLKP